VARALRLRTGIDELLRLVTADLPPVLARTVVELEPVPILDRMRLTPAELTWDRRTWDAARRFMAAGAGARPFDVSVDDRDDRDLACEVHDDCRENASLARACAAAAKEVDATPGIGV